jgi:predicted enzyme related to lactoylglutathione lyase
MQKNPICYWELASHNAEKSVKFFEDVFGWKFIYDKESTIHELPVENAQKEFVGGGIFTLQQAKLPFLTIYIKVEDIDDMAKRIEEHGGFIVIPPRVVTPGGPKICLFNEPSGVTFALIQSRKKES